MPKSETLVLTLPDDLADAVDGSVASGDYASTEAAVHGAVREWKERRENFGYTLAEMRAAVQEGIDSGPAEPGEDFMEDLRIRYASMAKADAAS